LIGKFNDKTFHVVGQVRACAPCTFIDAPWGLRPLQLRTTAPDRPFYGENIVKPIPVLHVLCVMTTITCMSYNSST